MLEVASLQSPNQGIFSLGDHHVDVGFPDGADDDFLLDYIDFSTCDVPFFHVDDGDILPDLEVDPTELLAEFADEPATTVLSPAAEPATDCYGVHHGVDEAKATTVEMELPGKMDMELPEGKGETKGLEEKDVKHNDHVADEVWSAVTTDDSSAAVGSDAKSSESAEGHSKRTSKPASGSSAAKNSHGRRKVKVDWTPELHRRFVQAVEQLGLEKAVPSRILELMGNEYCLTRHNIASHLQKYRSHRKHLMAREAEAASWTQKRQMYAAAGGPRKDAAAGAHSIDGNRRQKAKHGSASSPPAGQSAPRHPPQTLCHSHPDGHRPPPSHSQAHLLGPDFTHPVSLFPSFPLWIRRRPTEELLRQLLLPLSVMKH